MQPSQVKPKNKVKQNRQTPRPPKMFSTFNDRQKFTFFWLATISLYVCYFISYVQIINVDANYVNLYTCIIHILICAIIAWRFHPFRSEYTLRPYDPQIIFSVAWFYIFTSVLALLNQYGYGYDKYVRQQVDSLRTLLYKH